MGGVSWQVNEISNRQDVLARDVAGCLSARTPRSESWRQGEGSEYKKGWSTSREQGNRPQDDNRRRIREEPAQRPSALRMSGGSNAEKSDEVHSPMRKSSRVGGYNLPMKRTQQVLEPLSPAMTASHQLLAVASIVDTVAGLGAHVISKQTRNNSERNWRMGEFSSERSSQKECRRDQRGQLVSEAVPSSCRNEETSNTMMASCRISTTADGMEYADERTPARITFRPRRR